MPKIGIYLLSILIENKLVYNDIKKKNYYIF